MGLLATHQIVQSLLLVILFGFICHCLRPKANLAAGYFDFDFIFLIILISIPVLVFVLLLEPADGVIVLLFLLLISRGQLLPLLLVILILLRPRLPPPASFWLPLRPIAST
mgnify:CR=1 FL=1